MVDTPESIEGYELPLTPGNPSTAQDEAEEILKGDPGIAPPEKSKAQQRLVEYGSIISVMQMLREAIHTLGRVNIDVSIALHNLPLSAKNDIVLRKTMEAQDYTNQAAGRINQAYLELERFSTRQARRNGYV